MVVSERTNLLPVSKNTLVHIVPVHEASGLVVVDRTLNVLSVGFIAVVNLNTAGQEEECRTLIVKVVTAETCIVRRNVCKSVEVSVGVNLVCVLLICLIKVACLLHTVSAVTLAVSREGEVDHRVETVLIIVVVGKTLAEVFTCHPEVFVPICTCSSGVSSSPVLESLCTCLIELLPAGSVNVLCSIASEAVDTVLLNPLCIP